MPAVLHHPARLLLVLALLVALVPLSSAPAEASPRNTIETRAEQRLTDLHLAARRDPGAWAPGTGSRQAAIAPWSDLRDQARVWSDHQADGRCRNGAQICHNNGHTDGRGVGTTVCCWRSIGENVAYRLITTASSTLTTAEVDRISQDLMEAWMASPGHRRNILDGDWDDFGVSAAYRRTTVGDGRYRHAIYTTGIFRRRASTPPGSAYGGTPPPPALTARSIDAACRLVPRLSFRDLVRGSVVARAAGCLAAWDVTQGKTDGTYDGSGRVSRGQMASFLDRSLTAVGRRPAAPTGTRFADARGTTHAASIERLAAAGIVAGRSDGTYGPGDPVTRAQMATFLRRAYEHASRRTMASPSHPFRDVSGTHASAIAAVANVGIAAGTGPGTYAPNANVTRAQMAQFLARWLDLAVTDGLVRGPR